MFIKTLTLSAAALALSANAAMACEWHRSADMAEANMTPLPSESLLATHDGHGDHEHDNTAVEAGDLRLTKVFTVESPQGAANAGGFVTIENTGDSDDRLISASSDASERMEIHTMTMDGDVMRMRELPDGIEIPAGETIELLPGGLHVMFMNVDAPFATGEDVTVTLVFEQAGEVEVTMPVRSRAEVMEGMHNGDHGHHHGN